MAGACGAIWALAALAALASAQPVVRVRANTRIKLERVESGRSLTLHGSLVDDLDTPLAGRTVQVTITPRTADERASRRTLRTDAEGGFRVAVAALRGVYVARARFDGDAHCASSERALELDLAKAELRLRFLLPREPRIDLDTGRHAIALLASSQQGGAALEVALEDENGRVLARGRTSSDGTFRATLDSDAFGSPSAGRLIARSPGDALRSSALAELSVIRARRSSLSLRAARDPSHGRVVLSGSLRTQQEGLAHQAIGLYQDEEHLGTVLTDEHGAFRYAELRLPEPGAAARTLHVQARFSSGAPWIGSSASNVLGIRLSPPKPPASLWLLGPFAVTALCLWLLLRRARREDDPEATLVVADGAGIRAGPGRARGRPDHWHIDGEVLDASHRTPVRAALVRLERDGVDRVELVVDGSGGFHSSVLAKGDWKLSICASGYRELSANFSVPHRGQWSNIRVQLASLRSAAVMAYKPVAFRAMPSPELWQRWTLRETLESARQSGRATESFVQLTERVERAAYAEKPPDEAEIEAIESVAAASMAPRRFDGGS
jgi:hypothetical protein